MNRFFFRYVSFLFLVMLFSCFQSIYAQGFKIKEFKQNINDGSAFHAPMDAEGHPCGLIKVRTDNTELKFRGNIVGGVENKMNEYWVFMTPGTKHLNIMHPNFLPLFVDFNAYGIEISSKATYILSLSEQKYNKEKSGLVATVKPETAALYIDDVFIENLSGNGLYQLYLPKGDHICRMEQRGYRPNVQVVTTGKATQNVNVELESVMAELEIKCKIGTAEIYVDGELKGNGSWKGSIFAGEHQIEARQQNFESNSQTITIAEKESRTFVIPELKRSMGKIKIQTIPSGINVIVDGKEVGISPCTIDVESGKHYVSCKSYGIEQNRSELEVNSGITKTVTLKVQYCSGVLKDSYQRAYNGNLEDIMLLTIEAGRKNDYEQAFYWINKHPQKDYIVQHWTSYWNSKSEEERIHGYWQFNWIKMYSLAGNPEKALELYPIAKREEESNGGIFLSELYMKYIGDAFLKKKEYDKAFQCFEKAGEDGYEGLGDCYKAKGNKQLAASYYRKCLNLDYYNGRNRVEKKLKELEK